MRIKLRTLLISLVGLINIGSTLLPIWPKRYLLLTSLFPIQFALAAQHLTLFAGVLMLLLAYPAAQRHRRSAWILMACALLASMMNVAKGLDVEEALVNLALLGTLWRARKHLHSIPLRYTVVDLARLGIALLLIQRLYTLSGAGTLALLRRIEDRMASWNPPSSPRRAWAFSRLTAHLRLEHLFLSEASLALPIFLVAVFVIISWTALAHIDRGPEAGDLYRRFGRSSRNSLAYIANRGDSHTFIAAEGRGAISYKLVGRVALQIGAMLGPASERERVYAEFRAWLRSEGLIPAAVALSPEERAVAAANGMRTLTIGREAVVNLPAFSVDRLNKKMRWAQRSLTKRGFRCELLPATEVTGPLRSALARIDAEWRMARGGQTYGCCMTLGRFPNPQDSACLVGLMVDPDGEPIAYLTLLPGGEGCYSLDLTRRLRAAPNAAMELLMMETLSALRTRGASEISLNFSTFAGAPAWLGGETLARLGSMAIQTSSLEAFNNKFLPTWTPRYLAVRSWLDLPDVIYAILVVEGADRALYNAIARRLAHIRRRLAESLAPAQPERSLGGEGV
ncbi:MAG TPA: phosphatidylglycerol lysyltransferase domain-containing protein [Ktedonobacterales bacterium]|nr:phosphatidylglycerol lysyltransferase domain-containing protein [Ktedonobacterales bacterium]